jgi:hypothetical protein
MSDYELLKKLRNAGYPQVFKPGTLFCAEDGELYKSKISTVDPSELELGDIVVHPSFEELRKACQEILNERMRRGISTEWFTVNSHHLEGVRSGYWSSAVHLWIALHRWESK